MLRLHLLDRAIEDWDPRQMHSNKYECGGEKSR